MLTFFRRRVGAKIAIGYVLLAALMFAMGWLAVARLGEISATVDDLTNRLEVERQLSADIAQRILWVRFYANRYVLTHEQAELDAFEAQFSQLETSLARVQAIDDPQRVLMFRSIQQAVYEYDSVFSEAVLLIREEETVQAEVLNVQGLILENKLAALRVHSNSLNDARVFLSFGNAQNSSQGMRLNAQHYFNEGDERYVVLVEKNYHQARDAFIGLQGVLDDEIQRQNAGQAIAALDAYWEGFKKVQTNTMALRKLFAERLDVLEPQISDTAAKIAANIAGEFQERNNYSKGLVVQTRAISIGATIFAVLAGLLMGVWVSGRITQPLQQVMRVSQQIANRDLQALSGQLAALAQGDVRLNLQFSATPLKVTLIDEVGQMARAFNQVIERLGEAERAFKRMVSYLNEMARAAQSVAQGDLTVAVVPRSSDDILGNAILNMLTSLRVARQRLTHQLDRLATLRRVDSMIVKNQTLEETLQYLLEQGVRHLEMDGGKILLLDIRSQQAVGVAMVGERSCAESIDRYGRQVIDSGAPLHLNRTDENGVALCDFQVYYGLPLVAHGEVRGALAVFGRERLEPDSEWFDFLDTLAGQAAIAIANTELVRGLEERVAWRTRQLEEARRLSDALIRYSPVAIAFTDLDGSVTGWNPAAEKLFGYSQEEALGRNINDLVAANEVVRDQAERLTADVAEGEMLRMICQRSRKDGELVDVELFAVTVSIEEKKVGVLAIYHDITDLQQARQAAEAATRAKSEFLANMSHEIRTPMNGIVGMTSLLLDTVLNREQMEYAEAIRKSNDALLAIINDILDFSKIEAGKLELEMQPFDLRECIETALDLMAYQAADKDVELIYQIEPGTPEAICGDITRLRQILVNLISNAIKFTNVGEVVVQVHVETEIEEDAERLVVLHFSVRDTGIGIAAERLDRLFQSFSQVDASTTRKYGGTGLGLAICKRLVAFMDGEIWVESKGEGQGSTFHFTIRAKPEKPVSRVLFGQALPSIKGKTLLVVDDNATNRTIVARMAESWGMRAVAFASGREALARITTGLRADVAVLDVQMPEMDGLTLAVELRKHRSEQKLPIVVFSSIGYKQTLPDGIRAAAYLYKPIKPSQLYDALLTVFAEHVVSSEVIPLQTDYDAQMGVRHPLHILIAEDHPVNQKVAQLMLERLGYRADIVSNGLEVLAAMQRQSYDVILMDIQMPEMNGIEATGQIRTTLPDERQPRIIAMTANALGGEREEYLAAGMNDYLSKPVNVTQLRNALEKCMPLERYKTEAAAATPLPAATRTNEEKMDVDANASIDQVMLKEYFPYEGEDARVLQDLIEEFFVDSDRRLAEIAAALKSGDADRVGKAAHAIKGASLTFGARLLAGLCKELELIGKSGKLEGAAAILAQIEAEYQRARQDLRMIVQEMIEA